MEKWIKRGGNGALWLLAATLLSKLIGVLQKIPLQNLGGDTVFGLYNMVYPLYQLMLILAVSGIPTVISVMISEGDVRHREQLAQLSNRFLLVVGIVLAVALYSLSRPMSQLLGSEALMTMLHLVALTLCVVPLLASYRGYFQAIKLASYSSLSQLVEQLARVAIMVAVLYIGIQQGWNDIAVATYVMWGGFVGACLALIYLFSIKHRVVKGQNVDNSYRYNRVIMFDFIKQGIPAVLAAVIVPLLAVIDSFTIPTLLSTSMNFRAVTEQFGLYSRIQPLVQLVTMLLAATLAGAIPRIVQSKRDAFQQNIRHKELKTLLRYTIIIGSAATIGLYILAEPISAMLYKNLFGVEWFKLLAFMTLPASVLAVISPILLLEKKYKRLVSMIVVSIVLKLTLNIYCIVQLDTMQGAAYATLITLYSVAFIALYKPLHRNWLTIINLRTWSKTAIALVAMAITLIGIRLGCEQILQLSLEHRLTATLYTLMLVISGAAVLVVLLLRFKLLSKQDLKQLLK